jgi:hypothetical protein
MPLGFDACLGQGLQKTATIGVVVKDWLTTVTPVDDVINRSRIFDSLESWGNLSTPNIRFCGTDPFTQPGKINARIFYCFSEKKAMSIQMRLV